MIEWQKGDSFDISIFLCSLLIGVGYDAYCVIGKAPSEITLKNEGLMPNPKIDIGLKELEYKKYEEPPPEFEKYIAPQKPTLDTEYQKIEMAEAEEKARASIKKNNVLGDDEPDRLPPDQFEGQRIHCWVLVKKGLRGVTKNHYIEPSTGRTWVIEDNEYPYIAVDQVFNNKNFWINLKLKKHIDQVKFDTMDNGEADDWEYVMIDTVKFPSVKSMNHDDDDIPKMAQKESKSISVGKR